MERSSLVSYAAVLKVLEAKICLLIRGGKEYFYLTSDVIEEETSLSYKQQSKAIKDIEEAGYIESVIMGTPAKKYFHITSKIVEQLLPSSDKKEELKEQENHLSISPAMTKGKCKDLQNIHTSLNKWYQHLKRKMKKNN
jgi:hypothetical protein